MCANLKDSAQRGANLTAAVMLIANLDFADIYTLQGRVILLSKMGKDFL